jgi:hypothetical protein
VITSNSLRTLGLNKLGRIENGIVHLQTDKLCLYDTINWQLILNKTNTFSVKKENIEFIKQNTCGKKFKYDI